MCSMYEETCDNFSEYQQQVLQRPSVIRTPQSSPDENCVDGFLVDIKSGSSIQNNTSVNLSVKQIITLLQRNSEEALNYNNIFLKGLEGVLKTVTEPYKVRQAERLNILEGLYSKIKITVAELNNIAEHLSAEIEGVRSNIETVEHCCPLLDLCPRRPYFPFSDDV